MFGYIHHALAVLSLLTFVRCYPAYVSDPQAASRTEDSVSRTYTTYGNQDSSKWSGCSVANATLSLPGNQTSLAVPSGQKPSFVTVGYGIQNYTCNSGTFVSAGALATLYDVSCATTKYPSCSKKPLISSTTLPNLFFSEAQVYSKCASPSSPGTSYLNKKYAKIGDHYFISANSSISPVFVIKGSMVVASKKGNIPSPDGSQTAVDWLQLTNVQGTLAKTVFRVQTVKGVPPKTCNQGEKISVPYAAEYWFYN